MDYRKLDYSPKRNFISSKNSSPPLALLFFWDKPFFRILFHFFLGLLFGIFFDRIVSKIKTKKAEEEYRFSWLRIFTQLVLNIVFIASVEAIAPWIANDWQDTNAGMFFAAIFFSVQTQLYNDLRIAVPPF
jgi:hypothetical protein